MTRENILPRKFTTISHRCQMQKQFAVGKGDKPTGSQSRYLCGSTWEKYPFLASWLWIYTDHDCLWEQGTQLLSIPCIESQGSCSTIHLLDNGLDHWAINLVKDCLVGFSDRWAVKDCGGFHRFSWRGACQVVLYSFQAINIHSHSIQWSILDQLSHCP